MNLITLLLAMVFCQTILIAKHAILPMLFSDILLCTLLAVNNELFWLFKNHTESQKIGHRVVGSQPSPNQSRPERRRKKILSTAFSVVVEYVHICLDWDSIMLCFTANRLFIPNGLFLWPLLSFLAKKDTTLDFRVFNSGLEIIWDFIPNFLPFSLFAQKNQFRLWSL